MNHIMRTLIVPAEDAILARKIADTIGGEGSHGMWETPLGPTTEGPITYYVSSGYIAPEFAYMVPCTTWALDDEQQWVIVDQEMGNPTAVCEACVAAGLDVTQDTINGLFERADVTAQDPWVAFARLGVTIVQPEEL
jgi:hypothetical protein